MLEEDLIGPDGPGRDRRLRWAELLRRTFAIDIFTCARCGGPTRVVAAICDERTARRILDHLHLPHDEFDGIDLVPLDS